MSNEREQIRKDLAIILKADAQIDYTHKDSVERYYQQIMTKGLLTTPSGVKYRKKLEQIISGNAIADKCVFCNNKTQHNTMICPTCMTKLKPSAVTYCRSCGNKMNADITICPVCGKNKKEGYKYCSHCGNEVPMPDIKMLTNDVKNKSKDIAEQASKSAKENVQNIAKQSEKFLQNTASKSVKRSKKNISIAVILLAAIAFIGAIGLNTAFSFLTFIALLWLIYKIIKKETKKKAVITFIVLLLLTGVTSNMSSSSNIGGNNALDYIGAEENAVYKTYDKNEFYSYGDIYMSNENNNRSGLPHIYLYNGKVNTVILESGMNASLHVGGLHIGDTVTQMETCMKKLNAEKTGDDLIPNVNDLMLYRLVTYSFQYNGKDYVALITITSNGELVKRINVHYA